MENYFDVLELSIERIEGQDEAAIQSEVNAAHKRLYALTTGSYANVPRPDGKTQGQWQVILNEAKNTLLDPQKRQAHIDELTPNPIPTPTPDPRVDPPPRQQSTRTIVKFRNGDEATSIPQLATLMEKNAREATDILYQDYLEQGLAGAGETPFAQAARAVVSQFSNDRSMGLMAIVSILSGKVKMHRGSEAKTPKQLARLIDDNWEQAKTLLYNGFIALWLKYTHPKGNLSSTVQKVVNTYKNEQDIGLEELVQRLDPQIGTPEPEVSHSEIDFGNLNLESQKMIQFKIKNSGRGFLHGDVKLASNMPGLQISDIEIQGDGVVTVKLDASALTVKQAHQASLVVNTNGGSLKIPISCYVNNPVQHTIRRLAVSGISVAAIAAVTRLIIQQFASGWLATHLTSAGFIEWGQIWQWDRWFEWPLFKWPVYTLMAPGVRMEFVIALASLGAGIFAYWYFFFKKKRVS